MNSMQPQISVTLDLSLDTVLGERIVGATSRGDYEQEPIYGPVTLGDLITAAVAEKLANDAKDIVDRDAIKRRVDLAVDQAVAGKLSTLLDREITPTNEYGREVGPARTLAEEIVLKAEKWLTQHSDRDSYSRAARTNAQRLIDEAVGKTLEREVKEQITAARNEALVQIKATAARVFADELARSAAKGL